MLYYLYSRTQYNITFNTPSNIFPTNLKNGVDLLVDRLKVQKAFMFCKNFDGSCLTFFFFFLDVIDFFIVLLLNFFLWIKCLNIVMFKHHTIFFFLVNYCLVIIFGITVN